MHLKALASEGAGRKRRAVTAGQQTPSGTSFDPAPQFKVHNIECRQPLTVTGRCWFAPVALDTMFDTLASTNRPGSWEVSPCQLRVVEINAHGHMANELDQVVSARLVLHGSIPPRLAPGTILVTRHCRAAGNWERHGRLWLRPQQ